MKSFKDKVIRCMLLRGYTLTIKVEGFNAWFK